MSDLTKEELAEIESLEREDAARRKEEATAAKRQHLEALRLTKKLGASKGRPGLDFVVVETRVGNIALRRPIDIEIDKISDASERPDLESLAMSIVLDPTPAELQVLMSQHHGLVGALISEATRLLKVLREEESKK